MQPDKDVVKRWSKSAPYWEKHREVIRVMFAPVTQALVEDAEIGSGQTVLDIATGPGEPALSLAALVGPEGKICGIDPIPGMIEGARRAAANLGLKNVQFDVASADRLPFAADTFDAVICRFGVMFFPSPGDAVREILRVLKPGRKMALAVWHFAEKSVSLFAVASDRPPRPSIVTRRRCFGCVPLCRSWEIKKLSERGWNGCCLRTPAALCDPRAAVPGGFLDDASGDVRHASRKNRVTFKRSVGGSESRGGRLSS